MTKKVLIIGINYGNEPSIALSGRINIAVNALNVFIADYGILEENITYLTDELAPLTKDQIQTAIYSLIDESPNLEEIYIYYAGYGSGIRILKEIQYPEIPVPEIVSPDPVADLMTQTLQPDDMVSQPDDMVSQPDDVESQPDDVESQPLIIEQIKPTYKYEFAPVYGKYDKLTKQIVGSDYEIIAQKDIIEILGKSRCRTICVLDMCPFDNDSNIMWGTDITGNVNIISFSESDIYSSGKRAMIHTITSHFYPDV
jgi:hypothetical protein